MTLQELLAALAAALEPLAGDERTAAVQTVADGLPRDVRQNLSSASFSAGRGEAQAEIARLTAREAELQAQLTAATERASQQGDAQRGYETTIQQLRGELDTVRAAQTEATRAAARTAALADVRAAVSARARPIAVRALMADAERRLRVNDDGAVVALREDGQTHLVPTSQQTPAVALADELLATLAAEDLLPTTNDRGTGMRSGAPSPSAGGVSDDDLRRAKRRTGQYARF